MLSDNNHCRSRPGRAAVAMFMAMHALVSGDAMALDEVQVSGPSVEFRVVDSVATAVLWHSEEDQSYDVQGAFTVGVWPVATESQPTREGRRLVSLLLVGRGDLRETPVAVEPWSTMDRVVFREAANEGDLSLRLRLEPRDCAARPQCASDTTRMDLSVGADNVLRINGKEIGTIR